MTQKSVRTFHLVRALITSSLEMHLKPGKTTRNTLAALLVVLKKKFPDADQTSIKHSRPLCAACNTSVYYTKARVLYVAYLDPYEDNTNNLLALTSS